MGTLPATGCSSGLSGVLGGVFRHEDLLGRLGRDEFAVFVTSVKEADGGGGTSAA